MQATIAIAHQKSLMRRCEMKIKARGYNAVFDDEPSVTKIIQGDTQADVQDKLSAFARGYAAVEVDVLEH